MSRGRPRPAPAARLATLAVMHAEPGRSYTHYAMIRSEARRVAEAGGLPQPAWAAVRGPAWSLIRERQRARERAQQ
jgi:hypothetical protein